MPYNTPLFIQRISYAIQSQLTIIGLLWMFNTYELVILLFTLWDPSGPKLLQR